MSDDPSPMPPPPKEPVPELQPFATLMRELREERGWSQAGLAAKVGVHQSTISEWELARSSPSVPQLAKLCDAFEMSGDRLLGRSNPTTGLRPGSFLVDMTAAMTGSDGQAWYAKVPENHRIMDRDDWEKIRDAVRLRMKG